MPHAASLLGRVDHLLLVQPRVGIGDMVWHLPHIRALACHTGGRVTLLVRPRSLAQQLVGAGDGVTGFLQLERDQWGGEGRHQGVLGFRQLVADLRACRCDAAVLLTRSRGLALAAALAGIPRRYGYGVGPQRLWLNRQPYLPKADHALHPFGQAGAWLRAAGVAPGETEPRLAVTDASSARVRAHLCFGAQPFVAFGIGASDAWKKWDLSAFAALATELLDLGWPALVLVGGEADRPDFTAILGRLSPAHARRVLPLLGWNLQEVAAALQQAAFCVANDTATLNIAAAVGTRAYGLFGRTPVLHHSSNIVPVIPPGGLGSSLGSGLGGGRGGGMEAISAPAVLDVIKGDRAGGLAPAASSAHSQ